jgi:SAM-dependent methyltransferase
MEAAAERGLEPYGVELSDFGAQEIARRFGPGRVFRGRLEDARFGGLELGGFAAVLMYDFLEHVRDPVAVLGKARVLLAPGGILSICTPSTGSFSRRLSGRAWPHYHVEHLFYFGAENLATLLRRSGFDELRRERAWKWLSLRYVGCQLEAHPNRPLGALARALLRVLPATLADRPLPVLAGELLLHARRRDGQEDPR